MDTEHVLRSLGRLASAWLRRGHFSDCPRCPSRLTPVSVIRRQDVTDRILQRLAWPLTPTHLGHADTVAFDVTGELVPSWVGGVDPESEPDARAPPSDRDGVDPLAPDFEPDKVPA